MDHSLSSQKDAARKAAFAARKAAFAKGQPPQALDNLRKALAPYNGAALAGYMPIRTEIGPLPIMAAHQGSVSVPVIIGAGIALRFREWTPHSPMTDGQFGARIPQSGAWIIPRVMIVPLLGFDRRGGRLGYGGGFYDRTIESLRAQGPLTTIGFAFAAQESAALPLEETDQMLDMIVTETEILRL